MAPAPDRRQVLEADLAELRRVARIRALQRDVLESRKIGGLR
jgi:hypothetical protein